MKKMKTHAPRPLSPSRNKKRKVKKKPCPLPPSKV
jgi:hypothetical protein